MATGWVFADCGHIWHKPTPSTNQPGTRLEMKISQECSSSEAKYLKTKSDTSTGKFKRKLIWKVLWLRGQSLLIMIWSCVTFKFASIDQQFPLLTLTLTVQSESVQSPVAQTHPGEKSWENKFIQVYTHTGEKSSKKHGKHGEHVEHGKNGKHQPDDSKVTRRLLKEKSKLREVIIQEKR